MIKFQNISFSYNAQNIIFNNLSWEISSPNKEDYIHFILSPSGYGKSTIFKLILGILKPQHGLITLNDSVRISYVPQEPVLFEHLSIYENASFFKNIESRKNDFDFNRFNEFAQVLGLSKALLESNKNVTQLSGGQKRKLSLLKALSLNPNILLLDEPTSGLDAQIKMELLLQLKTLAKKHNILVLYITHHFEEALLIGDKVHYLIKEENGKIQSISTQTVNEFKEDPPCLEAVYLVDFPNNYLEHKGDVIVRNNPNGSVQKYVNGKRI